MHELDLINMYYNFIFNSSRPSFQYVYENYERLTAFKEWLDSYDIYLPFIHSVSKEIYELMFRSKSFEQYDVAFHTTHFNQFSEYSKREKEKYQVLLLSGKTQKISDFINIEDFKAENMRIFECSELLGNELNIDGPFDMFMHALYHIDHWPGIFVFQGNNHVFFEVNCKEDVVACFELIKNHKVFQNSILYKDESYFIQLSDLHLGSKKTKAGMQILNNNLDYLCSSLPQHYQLKFLITGDLMNSPNRKNMYNASKFMNRIKKNYGADVTFVLGNHDVIVHGLNLWHRQKTKVVAYLLGENIKVYPDMKIIVVKIDTTAQGNLARGKVGKINLDEIEDELHTIKNIEDYTLIAMMHHHLLPINKDIFLKVKWNEKLFIKKIADSTKALVDAKEVLSWLKDHNIHYVFHGHKHIPSVIFHDNLTIMSCGTSCGAETKERKSKYISYNMLKYNHQKKKFKYCFIFYDDITKQERRRVKITLL